MKNLQSVHYCLTNLHKNKGLKLKLKIVKIKVDIKMIGQQFFDYFNTEIEARSVANKIFFRE